MERKIITGRNKSNSMFIVEEVNSSLLDKIAEFLMGWLIPNDKYIRSEDRIIRDIIWGNSYYVKINNQYTPVVVSGNHIRTEANNTKRDNLSNLPIKIF